MPFLALDPAAAEAAPATTLGVPLQNEGMTLGEFRGRLNLMLGGRSDVTPTILDQWINAAYIDICSSLELEELKGSLVMSTVVDQYLYLLPLAVRGVRFVSVIDIETYGELGGRKLTMTDLTSFRRSIERSDEPEEFFRVNKILVINPKPTNIRVLSLDVWIRPTKLVDDADSPIVPEEWHEAILRNARTMAHSDLREWEAAAITGNDFVNTVRRKEDPDAMEEENKVIGSSVPRKRHQLFRRNTSREDDNGLR